MPGGGIIGHKSKAYNIGLATQADDAKYKAKYKELRAKIAEVEEDNGKLTLKILRSKKAIQRLRVERSILYDRLQSSAIPSNPFSLKTTPHLSSLPASAIPPSILDKPNYPPANPEGQSLYLQELDKRKLAELKSVKEGASWGEKPREGVVGEYEQNGDLVEEEEKKVNGKETNGIAAEAGPSTTTSTTAPLPPLPPTAAVAPAADGMQVDP